MAGVQQNISYKQELFAGDVIEISIAGAGDGRQAHARAPRDAQHRDGRGGGLSARSPRCTSTSRRTSRARSHQPFARPPRPAGGQTLDAGSVALAIVAVTVLVTSFISGIFGMAGGLILLGVLLLFMDVAPAMVLFGIDPDGIQRLARDAVVATRRLEHRVALPGRLDGVFLVLRTSRRCCRARRRST